MSEELLLHIELRAAALEREGIPAGVARAQAEREFGDLEDATEYCAAVDESGQRRRHLRAWRSEVRQDVSHACRQLRRAPWFATVVMLTLATGAAAGTTVYAVVDAYLIRSLPVPGADRLMWVVPGPTRDFRQVPDLAGVDWSGVAALFEATATWDLDGFTIGGEPHAEGVDGSWVSPGFFRAFGIEPAVGRGFTAEEHRLGAPVALLSHDLWLRRFGGDTRIIGATVPVYSSDRPDAPALVTVVGVLPRNFWPVHWRTSDLLRPLPQDRGMPYLVKLRTGVGRLDAQARLDGLVRSQIRGDIDPSWHMSLEAAQERHSTAVRPLLSAVFGAALFTYLAACASVAGALVSRIAARRTEFAVRTALGAGRGRIVRQLLTESAVLSALAGALGVVVAYVLLDGLAPQVERQLGTTAPGGAAALRPTLPVMAHALAASTMAGLLLGLIPVLGALRTDRSVPPLATLTGRGAAARTNAGLRRTLITAQVAVAMVLLFGAGLMVRTIARIGATDLGFRTRGVVTGTLLLPDARYPDRDARRQAMDALLARVAATPGVRTAAAVFPLPFWWPQGFPVAAEGSGIDQESGPRANVYTVSPDYFAVMDIPRLAGRTFRTADDHAAPLVVVISQALARQLSTEGDPIGRRIRVRVPHLSSFADDDPMPWRTVVGIVGDTRESFAADAAAAVPDVYVPYAQNPRARQSIVVRTDRVESAMFGPFREAVASVDATLALGDVASLDDVVARETAQRRGLAVLLGLFAAIAVGLSALALYASLAFTVVQRRTELAVRMAIGARPIAVLRLVLGEGLAATAAGVAAGIVAALALARVLENQLFGVGTADPLTLAAITLVVTFAALAACLVPAVRAVRTDPVREL